MPDISLEELKERGWVRLNVGDRFAPFANGNFLTPSGKCEFYSESLLKQGMDPLPSYIAPRESRESAPELAERYPLAFISPPAHNFLNSSFANLPSFLHAEKEPFLLIHPDDAETRSIVEGDIVRIFNDRGTFTAKARVTDKAREGVVVAPSVWWRKLTKDQKNANEVTSQKLTDLGAAATFYDVLVEVSGLNEGRVELATLTKTPIKVRPRREGSAARLLADQVFSRAAGAPLVSGNAVRLLKDGDGNYSAWLDAFSRAKESIFFESYIIHEDDVRRISLLGCFHRVRAPRRKGICSLRLAWRMHVRLPSDIGGGFARVASTSVASIPFSSATQSARSCAIIARRPSSTAE